MGCRHKWQFLSLQTVLYITESKPYLEFIKNGSYDRRYKLYKN